MYIREFVKTNKKTGARYVTHRLVESVRTPAGPRQRIAMHLGTLDLPKSEWKKLALVLEVRLSGQVSLFEDDPAIAEVADRAMTHYEFNNLKKADRDLLHSKQEFLAVDVNHVDTMEVRQLGPELAGHCIWEELQFAQILKDCGFNAREIVLAEAVVVGRLVKPGSELATWQWIRNRTALVEILGSDISKVGKNDVYEIADKLIEHKSAIEKALRDIECRLFPEEVTLFLYDLTNTYFESNCRANSLAERGKSKEKRSDCPLVTLALVVDSRGFPVFSQIYKGNQSEPETFKDILNRLINDSKGMFTEFMPTIVMDRGIATHDNLELLKARSYPYVIIERRAAEKDYVDEFTNAKDTFEVINNPKYPQEPKVYVKKVEGENPARVLCLSEGREQKEEAMDSLKEQRFIEDIGRLRYSVMNRKILKPNKVAERLGRLKERYPSIARYYDTETILNDAGNEVRDISWVRKDSRAERSILTGCYVIETSHKELSAQQIWNTYNTLVQVEYSFRCLKTDLGFRPIYHHKASRTEGHLFISVLAYHLLISIETKLRDQGDTRKWATIREELSTYQRSTISMMDKDGYIHHIRAACRQEPIHKDIFHKLKINDPSKRLHKIMKTNSL